MRLIDTDALLELIKSNELDILSESAISVITLIELLRGIESERERRELKENLEKVTKVLPIDNRAVLTFARLYRSLKREGKLIGDADLIQASIAIANGLKLLTRNLRHFKRLEKYGLVVEEPKGKSKKALNSRT